MTLAEELLNRMRHDELPPRERLEELLDFDPEKGTFHWKVDVGRRQAGDPAGAVLPDRHCITIDGKNYQARRIAWSSSFTPLSLCPYPESNRRRMLLP